ncbi:dihydrofolate reductase family protein [Vibrio renipiscarius]|uniref:Diacylglycerol kinase n=1 Tax=Vibrio renipiscarius TaxID=1461322 RepID=A0A0C2NEL1_9VIBR|nr:dihydrofolate reductase family protein [Vibrio renipiscarius]KII76437.1 diacylglycerol kinase [Vibrio renipiscarius]KII78041.1 diacylglycerol kinase [Vibrio renipiscarius]
MTNTVYIATSLDGYIADKNNQIDWLHDIPNPDGLDFGFSQFMAGIDALIMGRNTLEIVLSFDCEWPYNKPVFVLSNTMTKVPSGYEDKVFLIQGDLSTILSDLHQQGYQNLYIDGGVTIQNFLRADLIDQLIITTIPVLLGGGIPLFADLEAPLKFRHVKSEQFVDCLVQNHFVRERE